MCGRFALFSSPAKIAGHWHLDPSLFEPFFTPRYNISPGQKILAVRSNRRPVLLRWGLIPGWAKDTKIGYRLINARAETLWEKPAFRRSVSTRRCLIPADIFFEWEKSSEGKQPYAIGMNTGQLFAMAGLWDSWVDKNTGEVIESCTIITTSANANLEKIHGRMPAIVSPENYDLWLGEKKHPAADIGNLLNIRNDMNFAITPVSRRINQPQNDDPAVLEPIHPMPSDQSQN